MLSVWRVDMQLHGRTEVAIIFGEVGDGESVTVRQFDMLSLTCLDLNTFSCGIVGSLLL